MKVLYTGSFNPFHNGHQYVYDIACKCFGKDNVWIGIGNNKKKDIKRSAEDLKSTIHPITRNVITYSCLTADLVKKEKFDLIVRGVRPGQSLEEENDLLYWNRKLSGGVETILIPTPPEVNQISSSAIRELNSYNTDVSEYMNPFVYGRWSYSDYVFTIYFGKCCSGKSTFLKQLDSVKEVDKDIWSCYFGKTPAKKLQKNLHDSFYDGSTALNFEDYVDVFAKGINWNFLFSDYSRYDFPNLGTYWKYIPKHILFQSRFIKISTSEENRKIFGEKRGVNPKLIENSDFFYRDPPFWDDEIVIK